MAIFYGKGSVMTVRLAVIFGYFMVLLSIGFLTRTRWKATPDEYFLAGRRLAGFLLLGTMAATNFSAFTVFGASGAGYRHGYAFFPIVGFGTGFMALTFWLIGKKARELGKANALITPAELVGNLYSNRSLSLVFSIVMIIFTIPYIALQPIAGGYVLNRLFDLPQAAGACLVTLIIVIYTFRGGLRAVAWTDMFQGSLMVVLLIVAFFLVSSHHGGLGKANETLRLANPALLSRPGGVGAFGPAMWFSYLMLWFFCDPMFPQLFQRFFSARSEKALARTMLFYPFVCTLVFLLPVSLGVMGTLTFPGLSGKEADQILPILLTEICGDFMGTLIMSAGLAALMSTMDSQLLTLSSIFTRDIYPAVTGQKVKSAMPGKIFVLVLAGLGVLMAINPPGTILKIATQTFTGLAVLFPTVLMGLYTRRPDPVAAITSIISGEALVLLSYVGKFPSGGFLPAVPIIVLAFAVYFVVSFTRGKGGVGILLPSRRTMLFSLLFLSLFVLAIDWWWWNDSASYLWGFPFWVIYFIILSAIQTLLMRWWLKSGRPHPFDPPVS